MISSWVRKSTLFAAAASAALVARVSVMFIMAAGNWARVSIVV